LDRLLTQSLTGLIAEKLITLELQRDALTEAGCQKIFTEQMSGAIYERAPARRRRPHWPPIITQLDAPTLLLLSSNRQSHPLGSLVVHDRAPTAASSSRSISLLSTDKWGRTAQPG
jgi:hypothetical protein